MPDPGSRDGSGLVGRRLGSYRIEEHLGSGGMGTVYRAVVVEEGPGPAPGETVAVKVIHPHLLSTPGFFKRFLREAEIGRLVRHEHVVRTFDADALSTPEGMAHFLVMEFVEGRTLQRLIQDLGRAPDALVRELGRQAAAGLAAIHECGVIHRDLKPANMLVTPEDRVRIMDLGVAKLVAASIDLTRDGFFSGSLLYAAPEALQGESVGPAADLYSLGVVLYELATGVNPFWSEQIARVVAAHIHDVPEPPHARHPEVSPFLSELVTTLLEKSPDDRFPSAEAVRRALEEGEDSRWWFERERLRARAEPKLPGIPVVRETALIGRDPELADLRAVWRRTRAGEGQVVLVEGEAGIGKTRLVADLVADLGEDPAHVLYGSYPPAGGRGGLSEAILAKFGTHDLAGALRAHLPDTPVLVEPFATLVKQEDPRSDDRLSWDAVHALLVQLMRQLAAEAPVLWIVEDLHHAEPESRGLVLSLARGLESHRVLLVVTSEPGLPEDELAHLGRLPRFQRLPLTRLGAREVMEMLRGVFRSEDLADRLGGRVAYQSDGVPFFVLEMVRALREAGLIREQEDGSFVQTGPIDELEVPSSVKDLIEGRLRSLDRDDRGLLEVGAVEGFEFDPDLVGRVLGLTRLHTLRSLAEISRRSGVVRPQGRRFRFDHHQIREALYANLPLGLREELHALLANEHTHAAEDGPEAPGERVLAIAHHHLHGSRPLESRPWLRGALRHLENVSRNQAAVDLAGRALATAGLLEGADRIDALLVTARGLHLLGSPERENDVLRVAAELAEECGENLRRSTALRRRALLLLDRSKPDEALELLRESLRLAREATSVVDEAEALRAVGLVLERLGRLDEAKEHHERALAAAEETEDRRLATIAHLDLGVIHYTRGEMEDARTRFLRSLELAVEREDRQAEGKAEGNLGLVAQRMGRIEEARERYERNLVLARETGDRPSEAIATMNLAFVSWHEGAFETAGKAYEKGRTMFRELGDGAREAVATGNLGLVAIQRGLLAEAVGHFEAALALAREAGSRRIEGMNLQNLGELHVRLGDVSRARATLSEAIDILREIEARVPLSEAIHALGEADRQEGDAEGARRRFDEALSLAEAIPYPRTRIAALLSLGRLAIEREDPETAIRHLEAASREARDLGDRRGEVLAAAHRARLPGGDARAAGDLLERRADRLGSLERLEASHALWRAAGERTWLAEAHRALSAIEDALPEDRRQRFLEEVPLHREVRAAWSS
jgi:tetratricopeptide (TPR) repeat protein